MNNDGTNEDKQSLSDRASTEDDGFNDIAKALNEGNHAELDRLMAAEDDKKALDTAVEDEEDKKEVPDPDEDTATEDEEEGEAREKQPAGDEIFGDDTPDPDKEEVEDKKKEAAQSAASTAGLSKELEQELHRLRSDAGRVPFMQRRLAELERELRATKARTPTATSTGGKTSTATDIESVTLSEESQKRIKAVRDVDPLVAEALEYSMKEAILAANSRSDHVVDTFTQAEQEAEDQRFFMEQKAELARMIPQHETIFAMPEWRQWKETLTPGQRALAESGYASEVGQAIYAFAAEMQRRNAAPAAETQEKPVTPPVKSEVAEARSRKVGASAEVKNTAAKADEPFDEDKYFKEMYNMIGKRDHILP